ncbi:rhodanese-like domain-containing protein [Clostridium sp. Marseille-P2415]|uniref:rhodanese-like domain-containing protein n=1 Tax=Clostridium sp. Marseille-P2415 TaxID=1805471 RepID=UPI000988392F|nr:rhodanese-like domain-containing protein [Clostridium sp. Marseille-P2415]
MDKWRRKFNHKNIFILLIVLTIFVFFIITISNVFKRDYRILVDPMELLNIAEEGAVNKLIIDLRDREDYEASHIKNTINLPFVDASEIDAYLSKHNSKNKTIYLLCYSGNRSSQVFNYLSENGYKSLVYVNFGYEDFLEHTQDSFVPATGPCQCLNE